jgi:hypothetical protein
MMVSMPANMLWRSMACLVSPFEVCNCCAVTRTLASCGSNKKNQGEQAAAVTTSRLARMNVTVGCFEPENVERGTHP